MDYREHTTLDSVQGILDNLVYPNKRLRPPPGPSSVILHRLHSIHWSWSITKASFLDQFEEAIDIWESPIQELQIRCSTAWQQKISGEAASRKTFKGLGNANVRLTKNNWPVNPMDAAILRRCLNGTFITSDRRKYHKEENCTECPFCSDSDNQKHRHWECKVLESARKECPLEIRQRIVDGEPCLFNHGWVPNPVHLEQFQAELLRLPDRVDSFDNTTPQESFLELFTDGSCKDPTQPLTRLCAWGVAVATPNDPNFDYHPVSSGILQGLVQTISRAELSAILSACRFAAQHSKPYRVWTDSQYAIKQISKLIYNLKDKPPRNKPNHDLLDKIRIALIESGSWCHGIHKVSSHQDLPKLDPIEAWICQGNNAADSIAQHAFGDHPSLIHTWEILKEELAEIEKLRKWTHHVLIRVGHLAMDKLKEKRYTEDSETQVTVHTKLPYIHWTFPAVLPSSLKSYAIPEWKDVHDWILSPIVKERRCIYPGINCTQIFL